MIRIALVTCCVLFALVEADSQKDDEKRFRKCNDISEDIYKYEVETLNGDKISLKKFRGKVLLIVNVATFCGE
jgi:cytochrome oxidase Cu insertion factor (SCO1/SenC/PrrC family)